MGLQHFLTNYQRDYLKQLILECEVQRFTREESLEYIHAKLKIPISNSYMDRTKRIVSKGQKKELCLDAQVTVYR